MIRQLLAKNLDGFPQKSNIFLQVLSSLQVLSYKLSSKVDVTLKSFSFSVIICINFFLKSFFALKYIH